MSRFEVFIDGVKMCQFDAEKYLLAVRPGHFALDAETPACEQTSTIKDGRIIA